MQAATVEERLEGYSRFGVKLGLENMRAVCATLGEPQLATPAIHIGGTNGKGSTTAVVAAVLQAANYPAGRYTSPHLCHPTERIAVDGIPVTEAALWRALDTVDRAAEQAGCDTVTYFEMLTLAAFHLFKTRLVDAAVYEVGLGGRLDATNILAPAVTAITSVARDHVVLLGEKLPAIAAEKAGIVKPGVPVICGHIPETALQVIQTVARSRNARMLTYGTDFGMRDMTPPGADSLQAATWWSTTHDDLPVRFPLHGHWQAWNVACALAIVHELIGQGWNIKRDAVVAGVARVQWPGRMEWLARRPGVLFDCAHNEAALEAVVQTVGEECPGGVTPVLAVLTDKDADALCAQLAALSHRVVVSMSDHPRALPAGELAAVARAHFTEVIVEPRLEGAVRRAADLDATLPVFVTGSLMNYAQARRAAGELVVPVS